jgi:hypothetical protein
VSEKLRTAVFSFNSSTWDFAFIGMLKEGDHFIETLLYTAIVDLLQ